MNCIKMVVTMNICKCGDFPEKNVHMILFFFVLFSDKEEKFQFSNEEYQNIPLEKIDVLYYDDYIEQMFYLKIIERWWILCRLFFMLT